MKKLESVWCEDVLEELRNLREDIRKNEKDAATLEKKVDYLNKVITFVRKITFSRSNVRFCFTANAETMQKVLAELEYLFREWGIHTEKNPMVPRELRESIKVFKVKKRTIVLIDI